MIRKVLAADLDEVHKIYLQNSFRKEEINDMRGFFYSKLSRETLGGYYEKAPIFLVEEENKQIVGFIITSRVDPTPPPPPIKTNWLAEEGKKNFVEARGLVVDYIGVDKDFQRKGIGKELLYAAEDYCRQNKLNSLFAWVILEPVQNKVSFSFFEKNGFVRTMISEKEGQKSLLLFKQIV